MKDSQVTLVKSDGSTLYLTRDIAAARKRHEDFNFDRLLYVVDNSQVNILPGAHTLHLSV